MRIIRLQDAVTFVHRNKSLPLSIPLSLLLSSACLAFDLERRNRLDFTVHQSNPRDLSTEALRQGPWHLGLTYSRRINLQWSAYLSTKLNMFERLDNRLLPVFTLGKGLKRRFYLSPNIVAQVGAGLLYLMPLRSGALPFAEAEDYLSEIGWSVETGVSYEFSSGLHLGWSVQVWRGTATRKLQAYQTSLQLGYTFSSLSLIMLTGTKEGAVTAD